MKNLTTYPIILLSSVGVFLSAPSLANAGFLQETEYSVLGSSLVSSFEGASSSLELKQSKHKFFNESSSGASLTSLHYRKSFAGNDLHFGFSQSDSEKHTVLGYSLGRFTLSAMQGESESFVRDAGSFQGVDRFGFHGGIDIGFTFKGAGLDARLTNDLHAQIGFAKLESNFSGLEDRSVQYLEFSSANNWQGLSGLYGRMSFIDRGAVEIGQAIEAGFSYDRSAYMLQAMKVDGNKELLRFRTQFAVNDATNLVFDLSHTKDPQNFDETSYTSLFSIQHLIGKKPASYHSLKEENGKAGQKKKSKVSRPLIIGASVVAVAAIASSGSDSNDSSTRSQSEREAAFIVLNGINPTSVRENREYGGWVYRNQDNTYGSSNPVRGEAASVTLPNPETSTPSGSRITASYHTHAGFDPRFDNENFSPQDIRSDIALGIGGYLATPGGSFQYHFGGNIQVLGTVAN